MPVDLTIALVPREAVLERRDLLAEHREELTTDKARMVLDPHDEAYAAFDAQGALFTLGVLHHGELVGYSANLLSPHLHYRRLLVCSNDVLFLAKPYRSGRIGLKLIDATEAQAKERGADIMLWHAKPDTALDALLRRRAYRVQDIVYSRGL